MPPMNIRLNFLDKFKKMEKHDKNFPMMRKL
jgi:hypothetical protein